MTDFERALALHAKLLGLSKAEAKEDAEAIIREKMKNEHMTREFAEATFIEETEDANPEELAKMEAEAKKNGTLKVGARKAVDAYGKEHKRERKANNDKRALIQALTEAVKNVTEDVKEVAETEEHKIDFSWNGVEYSVTLTAHRKPKTK